MSDLKHTAAESRVTRVPRLTSQFLDAAPVGLIVVDEAGCIYLVNRRIESMLGCGRADLVGRHVEDVLPGFARGHAVGRRADGSEFGIDVDIDSVEGDGVSWQILSVRDTSDRVALDSGDAEIRQLLDAIHDGVVIIDTHSLRISFVNQGIVDQLGYSRSELVGMTPMKLTPHYTEEDLRDFLERIQPGESRMYTTMHRRRDGVDVPFEVSCQLESGAGTSSDRLVLLIRDVSERLAAEARLREAEHDLHTLEERERIAGDLHDTVLQRMFSADLGLQAIAGRISDPIASARVEAVVAQLDDTIRDLRTAIFGLRVASAMGRGLGEEVGRVVDEATAALGFRPLVTWRGQPEDVEDDVAAQLVPTVREALSNTARHAKATMARMSIDVGEHVMLRLADNGVGIGTGDVAEGGNGLRNMRTRAERLGGTFSIERGLGGGTRITWRVPNGAAS